MEANAALNKYQLEEPAIG
jgi:cyclin-dependent kinase